jgi:uncharacterized phage protein (predicted DNA packaging)
MIVSLDEVKQYLRVDSSDDDALIKDLISAAESLVRDVGRIPSSKPVTGYVTKVASLYAVAYLYEHREETDHKELMLSLRNILFGVREVKF